jgi:hypothetical protein
MPEREQPSVEAQAAVIRDALVNYGTWRMQKPRREKALAALDSLTAAYGKMEKERDEWEQRYTELLEAVGGTWPG